MTGPAGIQEKRDGVEFCATEKSEVFFTYHKDTDSLVYGCCYQ